MNPLHSIFIGLASLIVVALMVAIVSDGVLDHKSIDPALIDQNVKSSIYRRGLGLLAPQDSRQ